MRHLGMILYTSGIGLLVLLCVWLFYHDSIIFFIHKGKNMQTVRDLIFSGTVQENNWYLIDSTSIDIGYDLMIPRFPLTERSKSLVVTPDHYLQKSYGLDGPWEGIMLCAFKREKKTIYALSDRIYISHWGNELPLDEVQSNKMRIDELESGFHFFARDHSGAYHKLSIDDVAFLKFYYRIRVKRGENGESMVKAEKIRPIIAEYNLYDYYPTGDMKQRTTIMEVGVMGPQEPGKYFDRMADDRDKHLAYEVRIRKFYPKGQRQTTPHDEIISELTDKTHRFWLQNILRDYQPAAQ
jgi:hypothetical protein